MEFCFFRLYFLPRCLPCHTLYTEFSSWFTVDETGEIPDDMQVVFISVDPARDTPEKLANYITYFNKDFIGATANKAEIDKLTRQFGAGYIFEEETSAGGYNVAHTSAIFLVDPYGRLVASFSQPHQPATIVSQYKKIRTFFSWD